MNIGVYRPSRLSLSVERYVDNVCRELATLDCGVIRFADRIPPPDAVDLIWDPRAAGGVAPARRFLSIEVPLVATVHGAAPFAVPSNDYYRNTLIALAGWLHCQKLLFDWRAFRGRCAAVITVSGFARDEIRAHLHLHDENIVPIHHGVDLEEFRPDDTPPSGDPAYFLHVSSYQPVKNLERSLAAFSRLDAGSNHRFVAVVPGFRGRAGGAEVEVIRDPLDHAAVASLYRRATAFVFPSLRESFGMPIIEAMASGCPVLTSKISGCAEVAGDAAVLVDPRSVEEIAAAMQRLATDADLRSELRRRGLERARSFTWRRSAERHMEVFEDALSRSGRRS